MKTTTLGRSYTLAIGGTNITAHDVSKALSHVGIKGATIQLGLGLWEGKEEGTVLVTVTCTRLTVIRLAEYLRNRFGQDAVYVQANGYAFLVEKEKAVNNSFLYSEAFHRLGMKP